MQKRAFKFNIMDVLILLVILAVAAVLLYVFVLSDKPILRAAETHTVTYVVEVVLSPVDGFVTQYVTIEAEASLVSDGYPKYSIGGYDIFVGSLVYLSLPNLVCSGYCISLDVQ